MYGKYFTQEDDILSNVDAAKKCFFKWSTVCPRSSDPFYIVATCIKWDTTSWADGTERGGCKGGVTPPLLGPVYLTIVCSLLAHV